MLQGNPATSGCCSKCWRENQKKAGASAAAASPIVTKHHSVEPDEPSMPDAMLKEEVIQLEAPSADALKKKGKKKLSYKAMMKGMMHSQGDEVKAEIEKEALLKVTGGGAFQKIEKI
jgi:hypothetical protein